MITVNGFKVQPTMFPDGTSQVWRLPPINTYSQNTIEWKFENEAEFMHLAQLKHLLDETTEARWQLYMPYLPYGRQDKEVGNEQTFALRTFATLLNALDFKRITVLDAHSRVAELEIHNLENVWPYAGIGNAKALFKPDVQCFPDKGAKEKYGRVLTGMSIHAEKIRHQLTGEIEEYVVAGRELVAQKRVLIIDDICDGGKTFTMLAKELKNGGATEIGLYVTHGLFTKGLEPLKQAGISRIFTYQGEIT